MKLMWWCLELGLSGPFEWPETTVVYVGGLVSIRPSVYKVKYFQNEFELKNVKPYITEKVEGSFFSLEVKVLVDNPFFIRQDLM